MVAGRLVDVQCMKTCTVSCFACYTKSREHGALRMTVQALRMCFTTSVCVADSIMPVLVIVLAKRARPI